MIKLIKDTYADLFRFIKRPADEQAVSQTIKEKVAKLILIIILDIIISGIFILLFSVLESYGLFSSENHKVIALLNSMPKITVIFVFIVIVPLIEELIFRLYLRYKNNYLLRFFIFLFRLFGKDYKQRIEKRIKKIWYKKYAYIFYFSTILFGFVHIFNFDTNKNMLLLFPLITAPQISFAVFAGYLRVRYNLIWGYFLHAIHNSIVLLPLLLFGNTTEALTTSQNDYKLRIEEASNSEANQVAKFFPDSVYFQNYKLKDILAFTSNKVSWQIDANNEEKMNMALNLNYKNKSDSFFVDRKIIEKHLADLYKFKIDKEQRVVNSWELIVEDSLKLIQYRTDSIRGNYYRYSNDSAIIHRSNLAGIASAIQNSKRKKVFLKNNIAGRFDIKLNTTDTTDLKRQLDSIYGLKLVDSLATIEYLKIDFENIK